MTALSVDFPVLLGPVRIETRFTPTELLVRIFPDEWSVDAFEPTRSAAEVTALDAYWTARWAAAGRPDRLDAAFAELTARIPAGRATWLLQGRTPKNPTEEPTGAGPETVVLVVRTTAAVVAGDRAPTTAYWTAVWRAHGDEAAIRQADVALQAAVAGNTARANAIRARRPTGIDGAPVVPGDDVRVAFLVLEPPAADSVATSTWTQPAKATLLPDRFTVLGFNGGQQVLSATGATVPATLTVSPNPAAPDQGQIKINEQTGVLTVPTELKWLTDFTEAVAKGMGLRIPLTDAIRDGVDRLVVLGLREQSTPQQSATALASLITRQLRSPNGFALLPQGTPTNNSEVVPAGLDAEEEATAALRSLTAAARAAAVTSWTERTDGQQFAELLGLSPDVLVGMPNADGTDARDARAANTALWPATWGYFLQTALNPLLGPAAVAATRDFFLKYVSGRGPLPAVRIGRQPYGILPTTAFSKLAYPDTATARKAMHTVLTEAAKDWRAAAAHVPHLGAATDDAHQQLLDILALHPTSVEYHQRYAQSVEDLFNRENLGGLGGTVLPALAQLGLPAPVRALLARFGAPTGSDADPDLLRRLFLDAQQPMLGPLVDDRPLSETARIRDYTADGKNYLEWLAERARTNLDAIRLETGFVDDAPPAAVLYLLARHAVLLGWVDTARRLLVAAGATSPADVSTADPAFIHIRIPAAGEQAASESRFRQLYSPAPAVTGSPTQLLVDHIPTALAQPNAGAGPTAELTEQLQALDVLADLPTARLERVLAEHLDLATYRLDAWRLGQATERLAELRFGASGTDPARPGLHLGAYGWLEDVRPATTPLEPVTLTGPLATVFAGSQPLLHDPTNEGFVHAPSPAHARTAAVLRAGHVANRTSDNPGSFAVDLSSDRVRTALTLLDGLRQGQSLGALLGYRFERGLHDRHGQAEVDSFIDELRLRFPLRAGKIAETAPEPAEIGQVEARNVIDGLALVRYLTRDGAPREYPFGLTGLPAADADQTTAISAEAAALIDANDAVADLTVAEAAHQALVGNVERASATMDAVAKDGLPPEPAVIETPRSGTTLTHRFALQLRTGRNPHDNDPPRAQAEPAVDEWLPSLLPDPDAVAARVTWTDPVSGQPKNRVVTQEQAGLAPIDLLWAVRPVGDPALTDLDDRIIGVALSDDDDERPRPDAELTIDYTTRIAGKVTFFELSPLIAALRTLLTTARPLRPTDLVPAAGTADVDRGADDEMSIPRDRLTTVRESLDDLRRDVTRFVTDVTAATRSQRVDGIDQLLGRYAGLVQTASGFGLVRSGWGELAAWRRGVYLDLLAAVAAAAVRMAPPLARANALLAAYDALPNSTPAAERYARLREIEKLVNTTPDTTPPDKPKDFRDQIVGNRNGYAKKLKDLQDQAKSTEKTLSGLLDDVDDLLPLTAFDVTGLDLTPFTDRAAGFAAELLDRATALRAEVTDRLTAGTAALGRHDAAVTKPERLAAATAALTAMLGADALVVPEHTPLVDDLDEAVDDSDDLVRHLTQAPVSRDFPVDDWLHGVARVREMPRLWERVVLLSGALRDDDDDPELHPVQLPITSNDHWLAMEFAAGTTITEDRLLFTAHYADGAPDDHVQAGLLFDEWTEVIPAEKETTGIALHADSPDSEPPQAMLLVVPPVRTGTWQTEDLVAAVVETFDLARSRLVEPAALDDTGYAQLLPATVLSTARHPITVSTDLATANSRWKADHD